jgi:hypothetical protein
MPLKGSAAFANHSSSFFWSSFDSVEGWNSAIHFWIAASSGGANRRRDRRATPRSLPRRWTWSESYSWSMGVSFS